MLLAARMRRGFTLLEVMIVVAIIAVVSALVGNATQRSQRRARMHDAARQFRVRLEHARTLAQAAGPLVGTAMYANCSTGGGPGGTAFTIRIDPGANAYQIPTSLQFRPADGVLLSNCATYQVGDYTESRATAALTVNGGTTPIDIGFTPSGRLVGGPVFVRFEDDQGGAEVPRGYGFRILPSGVICSASDPANPTCDEGP